jgi:hypothetical protein
MVDLLIKGKRSGMDKSMNPFFSNMKVPGSNFFPLMKLGTQINKICLACEQWHLETFVLLKIYGTYSCDSYQNIWNSLTSDTSHQISYAIIF